MGRGNRPTSFLAAEYVVHPLVWYVFSLRVSLSDGPADSEADLGAVEYDMDEEDERFLLSQPLLTEAGVTELEFEYVMDQLEKHSWQHPRIQIDSETVPFNRLFITGRLRRIAACVFEYWKTRRQSTTLLRRYTPFSTKGAFAAFVSRPEPRNQRRRRLIRDSEAQDDQDSFVLLQQFRLQSGIARELFEKVVFREHLKRVGVTRLSELLECCVHPGKPFAAPLVVSLDSIAPLDSPFPAPNKLKVVFKLPFAQAPAAEESTVLTSPSPVVQDDTLAAVDPVPSAPEWRGRKKKPPAPRAPKKQSVQKRSPRILFATVGDSESEDSAGEVDSDSEYSLPDEWPQPFSDQNASKVELDILLNPQNYLRPSLTEEEFVLSRFADRFGRKQAPVDHDVASDVVELPPLCSWATDLGRPLLAAFRGRRRIARGGRVVWDRYSAVAGNSPAGTYQVHLESAPKRRKISPVSQSAEDEFGDLSASLSSSTEMHGASAGTPPLPFSPSPAWRSSPEGYTATVSSVLGTSCLSELPSNQLAVQAAAAVT